MVKRLDFGMEGDIAAEDARQNLLRRLDQPLGPARLLRLEGGHLDGHLSRTGDVLQISELPALQLCAIPQIGIFGGRVMLPAASLFNRGAAPHPGGAVEVEEDARART